MKERGGVKVFEGRVYARIRYGQNERFEERLPWASPGDQAAARERARLIAELCDQLVAAGRRDLVRSTAKEAAAATSPKALETVRKAVAALAKLGPTTSATKLTTFKDVAEDWLSGELRRKYPDHVAAKASFKLERARLDRYIYPHIKDVPIVAFEKAHADLVMSHLPAKRIKTSAARRHVAQIIGRVLNLAVMPLGLIKVSPLPRGFLPRIERSRHYTCLFPHEEATFLACKEVDEAFRLFIGVLDREGMRVSELADSEWWQWNLQVGTFTATKTKTRDPRMWALRPDVARAMRLWHDRHGKTKKRPFVDVVPDEKAKALLAKRLREGLKVAGVTRKELFEKTEHTGALRAHDMRATFVTISLAESRPETWIRDRTAHKTLSMIDRYRRTARQFAELKVGTLIDLVDGLGWGISWVIRAAAAGDEETESVAILDEFRRRDSNPDMRNQNPGVGSAAQAHAANDDDSDTSDDPPEDGSPTDHPGLRRLPADVQEYVYEQLTAAYRPAFAGDAKRTLLPLARAAKAIDAGVAPKRRRGAR